MKIAFNPSTVAALTTPPNNKDITFDLRGHSIFARGVEFKGTDTNTWRDIKINNVSIGSHTLDLRNGSNTTLTNTNGVVTINSTWRPVVDNLTSDSTTSSLSAKQGKVLKALIDGKSNSDHNHDDRYYTKAESNAKYITDITTSVNKLTFTRNGSNIIRDITVNVVHSQGYLTNIPNKDATTKASPGLLIYNSYEQTIGTNSYSSVLSINTGGTIQIAGNWGDDYARNLYWRSQSDRNVADYPWKSWRTILDSENYSSTLDSRYYTESEVNSLLDAKLNRQNLSYGNWNPRGWNLAADYHYNGGDLSISENNGKMYISVDGCFWQDEGQYRVLDTSDIGNIRSSVTLYQFLRATDVAWYPLIWGGDSHNNTSYSTGAVYKSYDKLCWQTSSQTLYATNIQTNNIKNLSIEGGIYWNPYVESASDNTNAASITLVRSGVAGGTTLVLSQMNDTNDTIQFKTNTAARLYHNSYPILTTQNTYVSNNKGYINGTEITQVNNSDKVDNRHAISTTPNTGIIYKAAIYTAYSLTSYWVRLASIPSINQNGEFIATIHVQSGHSGFGRNAILLVYLRGGASSYLAKGFNICCNSHYDPNRFRLYYKDSDKTSEIWYHTVGQWDGIITTVISQSSEGLLYEGLTLYSGIITAVQTPSMSTYLSAQVSTITDNISGNASTATKLQTARSIWGQSFDGTGNVSGSLSEVGNIYFKVDNSYDIGSDAAASRYIYTHWLGARSGRKLELGANNSGFGQGLCIDTNLNVGIGTNSPAYKLHVNGAGHFTDYVNTPTLRIYGTSDDMSWNRGPGRIIFAETTSDEQALSLVYTSYDSVRDPAGIKLTGRQGNEWFEAPRIIKTGSSDSYVLLGGGGHTLLSSLNGSHNHDGRYVRAFGTSNDNINSDWGQSFKTFDPIPSGTPPEQNPNISILNIGENFNRRKQLAFIWNNDNIYYRRHTDGVFTNWRRLAFANEIPTSLPANGGNADTVDNEHASNFSYTHQTSFDFSKRKSGRIVTFDQSNTDYGWINGFASTHYNYLTSVIFNTHRTSNWYVGYMEGNMSTGETNGLQAVHKLAFADGDESYPIFLGYLDLFNGNDGTISSSFPCLGYSVPFTYTRGGAYCLITIPNTSFQTFYIKAAIAAVHYSGAGMGHLVGNHRGDGAWWLHCDAVGSNAVQVKGFHLADKNNDSWWGGNPLYSGDGAAKIITVCLFGHVKYK